MNGGIFYSKRKTEDHRLYKHANFYTLQEVKKILKKAGFKSTDYAVTLSQKPEEVKKVEEPSCELTGRGIVCTKATKM